MGNERCRRHKDNEMPPLANLFAVGSSKLWYKWGEHDAMQSLVYDFFTV